MKRKILSIILVLSMLCAFMPVIATAATNGTCGNNVTWVLDDNGTLTISGTGAMKDYNNYDSTPWYDIRTSIKNVKINTGITHIGSFAFSYCSELNNITIPNSVKTIGIHAMRTCRKLKSIKIPEGVTYIGDYAFCNCTGLTNAVIPNSVTKIGAWTFNSCESLQKVDIGNHTTSIGYNAFSGCSQLSQIILPNTLKTIGESSFQACTALTEINIPNSVTDIGNLAFAYCNSVKSITIPGNIKYIPKNAFLSCKSLENVIVSEGIETIGDSAFSSCINLKEVILPESLQSIDTYAFSFPNSSLDCDLLTNIFIPQNVTSIGEHAFPQSIKITAYNRSYAHRYAVENNIACEVISTKEKKTSISDATVSGIVDKTYLSAYRQSISVNLNGEILEENFDYKIWYYDNFYAGTAKMLIVGIGDYCGSISSSFSILDDSEPLRFLGDDMIAEKDSIVTISGMGSSISSQSITVINNSDNAPLWIDDTLLCKGVGEYILNASGTSVSYTETQEFRNGVLVTVRREHETPFKKQSNLKVIDPTAPVSSVQIEEVHSSERDKIYIHSQVFPYYANNSTLTWASSDENIATVDDYGIVSLSQTGNVKITATTENGEFSETELNIEPLNIANAEITEISKTDNEEYSIIIEDKYGDLRKDIDYTCDYSIKDNILIIKCIGQGLYNGVLIERYDINTNEKLSIPYNTSIKEDTQFYKFDFLSSTYKNSYIYVAIYDDNGAMLSANKEKISIDGNTTITVDKTDNAVTAKVFIWDDNMKPILNAEEIPLI